MDVLNFISWIKRKDYRATVPANAVTVVGVPDSSRDDKFLSVVVPISAFGSIVPLATTTTPGTIIVGPGLTINNLGVLSVIPTPIVDEVINFNQLTPTTPGVIFTPNTPGLTNVLYVSTVDTSTWIWNGTSYQTISVANNTEWNFLGTSIDAGGNKTLPISRDEAIHTLIADSYFYNVRVGRGNGNQISNTVVGNNAGAINTTGTFNSFFGYDSGSANTIGESNTFYGYTSGKLNSSGNSNAFFGDRSGYNNTTANDNTFIGRVAGFTNSIGSFNTFTGSNAGYFNIADYNTFNGVSSGRLNTTGTANTFIGSLTGNVNTTGSENTFIGFQSGKDNTVGGQNTFLGQSAGSKNTTASFNTFLGTSSGKSNTTGIENTFLGYGSGFNNDSGRYNTFIGQSSGKDNITGYANAFLGVNSGFANSNGYYNTFIGTQAGYSNTTGIYNSFFGLDTGFHSSVGSHNTFIGQSSGKFTADFITPLTTVDNSVFLGSRSRALANGQTNQIVIGYDVVGKGSNTVQLGNTNIVRTYLQGDLTVSNATAVTAATLSSTKHFPIVINGVTYKMLLAD